MWRDVLKIFEQHFPLDQQLLIADCTLGLGGHSRCILETFPNSHIIATDLDTDAIKLAAESLKPFDSRLSLNHANYTEIFNLPRFPSIFPGKKKFDGIILDLGMSSLQLESSQRGFSFKSDGELDMRFNTNDQTGLTAYKIINFASEYEIAEIFKSFGEEKDAKAAAEMICKYRLEQKITSPAHLSKILNYAFFISKSLNKYDSITKCFQALRIFINKELENIETCLKSFVNHLDDGGIMLAISFHSLEDTLVLKYLKEQVRSM